VCHARGVLGLAVDDELVSLGADADIEQRFEMAKVFVERPEQGLNGGFGDRNLPLGRAGDSRISLWFSYLVEQ
jgi:hypothetical protein